MDRKRIDRIIEHIELVDIYLNDGSVKRDKNFDQGAGGGGFQQQSKLSVTADILSGNSGDDDVLLLRALVTAGVRLVAKTMGKENAAADDADGDGSNGAVFAEIEATFCVLYRYTEALSDDELSEFLSFNTVHNVWPFWREHALRVAAEAKLPRPYIPLMKPEKAD